MRPTYLPDAVENADALLDELLGLSWLQVTEARREYFMSDVRRSYVYGQGVGQREYHSEPYIGSVRALLYKLNTSEGLGYNVCFMNRYDEQKHQLGWHADDSPTMDHDHPIAVVSLGAARQIWWKKRGETGLVPESNRQMLEHGSLFVMPPGFQRDHLHRIPKSDRPCGVRVSLTFRKYR